MDVSEAFIDSDRQIKSNFLREEVQKLTKTEQAQIEKRSSIESLTQGMPPVYQEIYRIMFGKLFQGNREDEFLEIYKRAFKNSPTIHNEITNRINSIDFALKELNFRVQI